MRRQVSQENFSRVYRQFSRQRYNKYKHQFPRLREAQIVLKIIREWEQMDHAQKVLLSNRYYSQKYLTEDHKSNSDLASPTRTPFKPTTLPANTTQKTKTVVSERKPKQPLLPYYQEESEFNRHSEKMSDQVKSDRSSFSLLVMHSSSSREEKADLPKNHRYILFYKYHYKKLSKEHPNWTAAKLSQIIKLLWMRRQQLLKKSHKRIAKLPKQRVIPRITGRAYFTKLKLTQGYSSKQALFQWKQLPCETKTFYQNCGKGEPTALTLQTIPATMRLKSGPSIVTFSPGCQNLQFMYKKVKFD